MTAYQRVVVKQVISGHFMYILKRKGTMVARVSNNIIVVRLDDGTTIEVNENLCSKLRKKLVVSLCPA
jgi:hypothetical protein